MSKEQTPIEEYQNTGAIRCRECGLDLVETDFVKPYCPRADCKGIIFSESELKIMSNPKRTRAEIRDAIKKTKMSKEEPYMTFMTNEEIVKHIEHLKTLDLPELEKQGMISDWEKSLNQNKYE